MTRDTSTLMVGQYFKRRRELVEILLGRGQFLSSKSDRCKCSYAANIKHTLYAIYIFPGSICLFGCSKIGRLILGIYKSLTET
jgi:hypothetical protein